MAEGRIPTVDALGDAGAVVGSSPDNCEEFQRSHEMKRACNKT